MNVNSFSFNYFFYLIYYFIYFYFISNAYYVFNFNNFNNYTFNNILDGINGFKQSKSKNNNINYPKFGIFTIGNGLNPEQTTTNTNEETIQVQQPASKVRSTNPTSYKIEDTIPLRKQHKPWLIYVWILSQNGIKLPIVMFGDSGA